MHHDAATESAIQKALGGTLDRSAFDAFCATANVDFNSLCNSVALTVARRFNDGSMSYEDADEVMNVVYGLMTDEATRHGDGFELAEPALKIYLAFDEGEYDHRDGKDPVKCYTKPLVKQALGDE